jgi:LysR family glycine cleavage system transcriptional activator
MFAPRRFLPSLSLLSAFEAAARMGSITTAAKELNLTQSAVSRQIKALEEQVGVELFVRERQTIRLTLAGDSYAREIREALRRISTASLNLRANPEGGTLNIAILPSFGTRWLAPRLGSFLAGNPGITINLISRLRPFDMRLDSVDAAIHFGEAHWPGAELTKLMGDHTVPACSPALLARSRLDAPADFLTVPLLHLTSRPDAWEKWFASHDVEAPPLHGMLFDEYATAAAAAVSGLGVGLFPSFLIEAEIDRGELVAFGSYGVESEGAYYLACAQERVDYGPLSAFRRWVADASREI